MRLKERKEAKGNSIVHLEIRVEERRREDFWKSGEERRTCEWQGCKEA
jgi:hypothetical protein